MNASEAAQISRNSRDGKLEIITKLIEHAAEKGMFYIIYPGIPDLTIKQLENMGYRIELSIGRYADRISWGNNECGK